MVQSSHTRTITSELWPIFICYRQVDGLAAALRLHELLDTAVPTFTVAAAGVPISVSYIADEP